MFDRKYYSSLTGGFPRTRSYAQVMSRYLKKKIDREKLFNEALRQTEKIFERLIKYNINVLNDGMYLCDDILNPFSKDIENTATGWLVRFYENNFFVRNTIIKGKIRLNKEPSFLLERLELLNNLKEKYSKELMYRLPVPGPLTFLDYSSKEVSYDDKQLVKDYIENVLMKIEKLLLKHGILMEIHDPSLSKYEDNKELISVYINEIQQLRQSHFLITYFGAIPDKIAKTLGRKLILGYDLVEVKQKIISEKDADVQLGVLDSRNTKLEDLTFTVEMIKEIANNVGIAYLSTNAPLEFLPEIIAYRKARLLGKIALKLEKSR